jgi:hypothetical protein
LAEEDRNQHDHRPEWPAGIAALAEHRPAGKEHAESAVRQAER